MSDVLLDVRDLAVMTEASPTRTLVDDVSFSLRAGEVLTLLGESGSGKSLLAQAVMGTLPTGLVARGHVRVGGVESRADDPNARRALWGRQLALLPQEPWSALDPTMRAHAQVAETHRLVRGLPAAQASERATADLTRLGLAADGLKYPFLLSGGMAQRVAFAATTAAQAPILIVDEPTKGLDHALRDQVIQLLQGALSAGGALLVITHDVALPRALGGQVAVMREAQVVERGPCLQVLRMPSSAYTRELLAAEPACWPDVPNAGTGAHAGTEDHPPLVEARDIALRWGARTLFDKLTVAVRAGERLAITGPSGSGKTSLGNVLLGLVKPSAGTVRRAPGMGPQGFQKLYQDPLAAFAPRLTLRTAMQDLMRLHGVRSDALPPLLDRLGLSPALLERRPHQVSGGELQRIALARMLLLRPALVFADEPTSRLDPINQKITIALLLSTLAERGGALLLVTHDPVLARKSSDRCLPIGAASGKASNPAERHVYLRDSR
jgi:peptide/nickel transport system ATP-binding protein